MQTIRSVLHFVAMVLTIITHSIAILAVGWLLPPRLTCRIAHNWAVVNRYLLRWICGLDYRVEGAEHFDGPNAIVLSKHQSAWETIFLWAIAPPFQAWVLKRELTWIPIFGWTLKAMRQIAIDRSAGKQALREIAAKGQAMLEQGRWVIIFPEGTRVAPGERKKYGAGGGMLAQKSGYPVIPIAHNAGVFWRRRGIIRHSGTIRVIVGPPLDTADLSAAEITRSAEAWIEARMLELPATLEEARAGE